MRPDAGTYGVRGGGGGQYFMQTSATWGLATRAASRSHDRLSSKRQLEKVYETPTACERIDGYKYHEAQIFPKYPQEL